MPDDFSARILRWFEVHGRKDLPWQINATPYRVWVSEIMLQQTQVTTVIPYYQRFMQSFPTVEALAEASHDEVMEHWSGLGYYARARNLHKAAKSLQDNDYELPNYAEGLIAMPGIGRSTAGAILSLAYQQHAAILDGNVKRVLARHYAIEGWPGKSTVLNKLWDLTEDLTPVKNAAHYNQAMMDMGATLCKRSKPKCDQCPVSATCQALAQNRVSDYPESKPKKVKPTKYSRLLMLSNADGQLYLQRRPPTGIWGGLWVPPLLDVDSDIEEMLVTLGLHALSDIEYTDLHRHELSHFSWDLQPLWITVQESTADKRVMEAEDTVWYNYAQNQPPIGYPAPISKILADSSQSQQYNKQRVLDL